MKYISLWHIILSHVEIKTQDMAFQYALLCLPRDRISITIASEVQKKCGKCIKVSYTYPNQFTFEWHLYERNGFSNHRRIDCLLNRLFRRRSKKTSKLCVTGLCEGNPPVTGGFPSQRASNAAMSPSDDVIWHYVKDWITFVKYSECVDLVKTKVDIVVSPLIL